MHKYTQVTPPPSYLTSFLIQNTRHVPLPPLRPPQHLLPLLRQLRLPAVSRNLVEEDGLPRLAPGLARARLDALRLLELHLDGRGLGELPGVDGVRDAAPELERLVRELLFPRRQGFGRHEEGAYVDDGVLLRGRVGILMGRSEFLLARGSPIQQQWEKAESRS